MRSPDKDENLATLTHARLRARQGDYAGAATLLRRILAGAPDHGEARELLRSIEGRGDTRRDEAEPEPLTPRQAADPGGLAPSFRRVLGGQTPRSRKIRRLERWLARIRRGR